MGPEGPVLQKEVSLFLQAKLGLETKHVKGNTGILLVTQLALQQWTDSRHWDVMTMKQIKVRDVLGISQAGRAANLHEALLTEALDSPEIEQ
jgi:hypothetical protein